MTVSVVVGATVVVGTTVVVGATVVVGLAVVVGVVMSMTSGIRPPPRNGTDVAVAGGVKGALRWLPQPVITATTTAPTPIVICRLPTFHPP
ncbi:hypothetical protein [Nocardia seriolae]|uniref:Uncharacterized protein n=1 Tax=Nocardia seriolae TaxID=37332 RepID=A0A0B8NCL8_9NOCA|nr:hypothetical protein [Nocardia seriolae]APA99479.1 hypothetical protein NS506_05433 [Nocardia seriolae]MTJ63137.1 hypothetical protein [Nocardia seriolae]MTJ74652.1 hypothetical protein [Nocardia seriolae]MTJ89056.1 hypothetical protein [Nocardia seriolae]MTK33035.1 hypothetical protein [Nocardia seriolae]